VTSAYTVVKDPEKVKFVYRDRLWEGADLLSCGVASFGHLGGVHYQNQAEVGPYMEAVDAGEPPIFRAYSTSEEERFVREFVLKFKLGSFRPFYYQTKFGQDVLTRFASQFAAMEAAGMLVIAGPDEIRLTREGLLQSDRLCHDFFLPQHTRYDRYT
jgi:oxygen-independent coproporphyrinogen-3 oxidase